MEVSVSGYSQALWRSKFTFSGILDQLLVCSMRIHSFAKFQPFIWSQREAREESMENTSSRRHWVASDVTGAMHTFEALHGLKKPPNSRRPRKGRFHWNLEFAHRSCRHKDRWRRARKGLCPRVLAVNVQMAPRKTHRLLSVGGREF